MTLLEQVERAIKDKGLLGFSAWRDPGNVWQVSVKQRNGTFDVHKSDGPLEPLIERAFGLDEADDLSDII